MHVEKKITAIPTLELNSGILAQMQNKHPLKPVQVVVHLLLKKSMISRKLTF